MKVNSKARIASLDGVRAVSIALVIFSHVTMPYHLPALWRIDLGKVGVQVFFVISGFIISTMLLEERRSTGSIDVRAFYARRIFRIMPAYYVFLAAMALLIPTGWLMAQYHDLPAAALYYSDYIFPAGTVGHTWSLAVEEQFYLLWPGALVLLGTRRSLRRCFLLILAAPAFRIIEETFQIHAHPSQAFECVCDSLAAGCVLAILRESLWARAYYRSIVTSGYLPFAPLAVILFMAAFPNSIAATSIGISMLNVVILLLLDRYMRSPSSAVGKFLNSPPVVFVGRISYSLYLWQQPFMFNRRTIPAAVKIIGAMLCATGSYYFIEKPFLRLRAWLQGAKQTLAAVPAEAP